jgi:hypothetical protein
MTKAIPTKSLQKTIAYFYLLSYCPPEKIADFKRNTAPMRRALAENSGMKEAAYFAQAIPEVCRRIVAFHQATREPDQKMVEALAKAAQSADKNLAKLTAYQTEMAQVAASPGRAKPENRLHRNKGCALCSAPCQFGFFTLVSDPQFSMLQEAMKAETERPAAKQSPLLPLYGFALHHITQLVGVEEAFIESRHVVNLSFCLLLLAIAKSRVAVPEAHLRLLQAANREFIRRQTS